MRRARVATKFVLLVATMQLAGCSSCASEAVPADRWMFEGPVDGGGEVGPPPDGEVGPGVCDDRTAPDASPSRVGKVDPGRVECWGTSGRGATNEPSGQFVQITAGPDHNCGVRPSDRVECWGRDNDGQASAPGGRFQHVDAGFDLTCGLTNTWRIDCWGRVVESPPAGSFVDIAASGATRGGCAVASDGDVECWDATGMLSRSAGLRRVDIGEGHACGTDSRGLMTCWGWNTDGQADAPTGRIVQFDSASNENCAIRPTGDAVCWGVEVGTPPPGPYRTLGVGAGWACAVRCNGRLECWGDDAPGGVPNGRFTQVAVGDSHACAIRE